MKKSETQLDEIHVWDFKTLVTEEELLHDPERKKIAELVIQHTPESTYQVLVRRHRDKQWAALATRRAPLYPRQIVKLPALIKRIEKKFPYIKEVTIEELKPRIYRVRIGQGTGED